MQHFILAGHSQGGLTSSRSVCTDYFKDKVDVRISLSGGRVGPAAPANRGFFGGACDYSFIFSNGEYESIPADTSPLADKFGCARREQLPEVLDPKPDPGTDGWGRAQIGASAGVCVSKLQRWTHRRGHRENAKRTHRGV